MSKILQIRVGMIVALFLCSFASSAKALDRGSSWTPTSTLQSSARDVESTNKRDSRVLPKSLRALDPDQARNLEIARVAPLVPTRGEDASIKISRLVAQGDELLAQRKWFEAKKFFEKGLREFPNDPNLYERFVQARRRQEIAVRYQDSGFATLADSESASEALALFDEVCDNIDCYHVDLPDCNKLFELGMAGVGEALSDDAFYRCRRIPLDRKECALETFRLVNERLETESFETREELERAVLWVARQLRRRVGIKESAILAEFLCSASCSLDPYSASLTPMQVDDVFSLIDGKFVGIGVELKTDAPTIVSRVIPNSPAEEARLKVGEEIVKIDGRSTSNLSGAEIGELLQGKEGEETKLEIRAIDGALRAIVAVRRAINVPSVEDVQMLNGEDSIGYLKISCFQKSTTAELSEALQELSRRGAKSLVIDLRQNPGGLLQEAINASDLFLDSGVIVRTRGRNGNSTFTARAEKTCALPLVVLIDSASASAAEIFAGAMQENRRAVVVGEQSYGKGTVQAIVQLSRSTVGRRPIAGMRLTTEKFFSPTGRAYSGVGVHPNVDVAIEAKRAEGLASTTERYAAQYNATTEENAEDFVGYIKRSSSRQRRDDAQFESDLFLATAVREARRLESNSFDAIK